MLNWSAVAILIILSIAALHDGLKHQIPDWLSLSLVLIALLTRGIEAFPEGIILLILLLLLVQFTHSSLGGGDIKLCSALGMSTGIYTSLFALILALLLLILWAAVWHKKSAIPVAPFLLIAYIVIHLKGVII